MHTTTFAERWHPFIVSWFLLKNYLFQTLEALTLQHFRPPYFLLLITKKITTVTSVKVDEKKSANFKLYQKMTKLKKQKFY